ncbi:hypothetical protein DSECCO2_634590 [anaerobic digester metagenome]
MDSLNTIPNSGSFGDVSAKLNDNFSKVGQSLTTLENVAIANKGYFDTLASLQAAFPSPKAGNIAYVANVASSTGYYIYNVVAGVWTATTTEAPAVGVAISDYAQHGYSSSPKTLKQVDDEVVQLAGDVKQKTVIPNIIGYIHPVGSVIATSYLVTNFERYISGDIVVSGYESPSAKLLFFYDKYFQPISPYTTTTGTKTDITITQAEIPIGTAFVRSQSREQDNNGLLILKRDVSYYVPSNEEYIDSLLMEAELDSTTSVPYFNGEILDRVEWIGLNNRVVRTDTFTFSETHITETRTMEGATKVFTTELSTFKTTII